MYRQDQRVRVGDGGKEFSPRDRRLLRIPIRLRRPVGLATLDHVMHEVAGDDGALSFREDVDATMAGRMAGRGRQRDGIVERVVVVDQNRLPRLDNWQTIVAEDR